MAVTIIPAAISVRMFASLRGYYGEFVVWLKHSARLAGVECAQAAYPMSRARVLLFVFLNVSLPACGSATTGRRPPDGYPIVQPGAPGEPSRVIGVNEATDLSHVRFTPADVRFMQEMIGLTGVRRQVCDGSHRHVPAERGGHRARRRCRIGQNG